MLEGKIESGADQVVIICPDINVKAIDAALRLSINDLVNLDDDLDEARVIKETLACLGAADGDISSDKLCITNLQGDQEQEQTISGSEQIVPPDHDSQDKPEQPTCGDNSDYDLKSDIEEMDVISACNDSDYTEQLSEEEEKEEQEEEPESTLDPVTGALLLKDLKCPMCSRAYRSITLLKMHMAKCHLEDAIMKLAGTNTSDVGTMCHLCGKNWAPLKSKSENQTKFFRHIALSHRYLDKVLSDTMRTKFNEDILKARPQVYKRTLFVSPQHGPEGPSCPLCNKCFTGVMGLRVHLILSHFMTEILETSGVTDYKRCYLCLRALGNRNTEKKRQRSVMALHVATKHGYLEKVMDRDLKQKWKQLKKMPLKERVDLKRRRDPQSKGEISRKGKEYNISLKCPLCSRVFHSHTSLTLHFCSMHYKKDVLRYAKTSDKAIEDAQCNICGKQLKKDVKKRSVKAAHLSKHLAMYHKLIDKVVPEKVKKQFNRTLLQAIPNIKKTWLFVTSDTVISGQQCLLCEKRFEDKRIFKDHMISVHFLSSIIDVSQITDINICNICDKPAIKGESEIGRRFCMVRHLALKHNFLTKVLEKEGLTERWVEVMDNFKSLTQNRL